MISVIQSYTMLYNDDDDKIKQRIIERAYQ